jgi:hypothetical protein
VIEPGAKFGAACVTVGATLATRKLPHGVWPGGNGSRRYVGRQNTDVLGNLR